jgi:hypothetical protein
MLSLQDALNEYPGLEPVLLEAWQRHITREQVGASQSRQSDSPSERVSNELLTTSQIAKTVSPALQEGFPPQATGVRVACRRHTQRGKKLVGDLA